MKNHQILTFVALAFIISGVCGLIYEVVWAKYLSLFIGNTTYAHTVVLATFMGGLAAGAWFWGRRSDGATSRLRLYATLEFLVGIYCFAYPSLLGLLEDAYIAVVSGVNAPSDGLLVLALKLIVSFLSLFFPTFLMGGTLPVLARFITKTVDDTGKEVGILYFLNSFGAVIGSFFAGFILIEALGLRVSIYSAAVMNLIIGAGMYMLSLMWKEEPGIIVGEAGTGGTADDPAVQQVFTQREIKIALATACLSGFAAMVYELTWIRLLTLIFGSSVYSFSLMLMAFISGITIGSLIVSKIVQRVRNLYVFLGVCELAVGVSMLIVLPLYQRLPYYFWALGTIVSTTMQGYYAFVAIEFFFCFILMLLPTIFLGMALPIISRIAATDIGRIGKSIGNVFSINTIGTVFGSLFTGLLFIPWIGVHRSIELGIALNLALATLILLTGKGSRMKLALPAAAGWIIMGAYLAFAPVWSSQAQGFGLFRARMSGPIPASYEAFQYILQGINVKYFNEGVQATVSVTGEDPDITLLINGKPDASSHGDLGTQLLAAHLPGTLSEKFDTVLIVGLGSGITVGAATRYPVKHIDVIEISPEVRDAVKFFSKYNHDALADPRVTLTVEDAITYLKTTKKRYDVIINEPSNPWIAGIGNLFTREFFELAKNKLTPSGMMIQWIHLYESNDEVVGLILRTFNGAFPYVSIWTTQRNDVVFIGSRSPLGNDFAGMERRMLQPEVGKDLQRINIRNLATLLSTEMVSPEVSKTLYPFGVPNTEENPYLEYMAPKYFFLNGTSQFLYQHDLRNVGSDTTLLLRRYLASHTLTPAEYRDLGLFFRSSFSREYRLARYAFEKYLASSPHDPVVLAMYSDVLIRSGKTAEGEEMIRRFAVSDTASVAFMKACAQNLYQQYMDGSSIFARPDAGQLEQMIRKGSVLAGDTVQTFEILQALLDYRSGKYREALRGFKRVMRIRERTGVGDPLLGDEDLLAYAADAAVEVNDIFSAVTFADQALEMNTRNVMAMSVFYRAKQKSVQPIVP